jgi:hypothetical protein
MYTRYQVVLVKKQGDVVLSEWQTQVAAYEEARKVDDADCIRVEVRAHTGAF